MAHRGRPVRASLHGALALAILFLSLLGSLPASGADEGSPSSDLFAPHVPGEILVKYYDADGLRPLSDLDVTIERTISQLDTQLIKTDPERMGEVLTSLRDDPNIAYAEPNYRLQLTQDEDGGVTPDDPEFDLQWGLRNNGQATNGVPGRVGADISAPEAWRHGTGNQDVIVAVIDSGVDFTNPDLGGSQIDSPLMWTNPGEGCPGCPTDGQDNDGNGYIDDWRGWDWVNNDGNPADENGHGTHVTGTIAARGNNGVGVAGIAWDVQIMALKTFGTAGGGDVSQSIEAILYAVDHGAQIINASWGSFNQSLFLRDAIDYAGEQNVLVVAAAGNDGINTDLIGHFPSALDIDTMIAVGASNNLDELADFSNYGVQTVDMAAPGANIYSTWTSHDLERPHRYLSGTSMATPHVTGAAALTLSRYADATPVGVKNLLFNSVDVVPGMSDRLATGGRLNVGRALSCEDEPQVWIDRPVPEFAAVPENPVELRVFGTLCAAPDGVDVAVTVNGEPVELDNHGNGLYTGEFSPDAEGPLTITATATSDDRSDEHTVSGRVVLNYEAIGDEFEWLDATTGEQITFDEPNSDVAVETPFPIQFYDRSVEQVRIGENGLIGLGDSRVTQDRNTSIPDVLPPNGFAAPFWDDLSITEGHGEIWYETFGEAPDRRFVVSWVDVPHISQVSGPVVSPEAPNGITFQAVFEESTGDILFQYQDVTFGNPAFDFGNQATVGVEHYAGTIGSQFSDEEPGLVGYAGETSIRFRLRQPGQPAIQQTVLPPATVGDVYNERLAASGGEAPYTWSIVDGDLPEGIMLDPSTGAIVGTSYLAGSYQVTVEVADGLGATSSQIFTLDVVPGYKWTDAPLEWLDPTGGEVLPFEDDDQSLNVSLPFAFTFYGESYEDVQVSSNGYLVFGPSERITSFLNREIPDPRPPNGLIAGLWDDLSPNEAGEVLVHSHGDPGERRVAVTWLDVPRFPDRGAGTFQIVLEESTGDILLQYLSLDFETDLYTNGASATIGVEHPGGTVGTLFSHNDPLPEQYVGGDSSIRFTTNPTGPPEITTERLADAEVGSPYLGVLVADNAQPPVRWEVEPSSLPAGVSLDPVSGALTGTPQAIGTHTIPVTLVSGEGERRVEADVELRVLPTYDLSSAEFEWIEPAGNAERLEFDGDNFGAEVGLPFPFRFYGEEYETVYVSSNGFISVTGEWAHDLSNDPIPDTGRPNGIIAGLWDDLVPQQGDGVWIETVGEAPERRFVVTYVDIARFNDVGGATFQIVLEEGTNAIQMSYQDVDFDDGRYDYGASATVGVEAPSGMVGTQFSYNEPSLRDVEGERVLRFEPRESSE